MCVKEREGGLVSVVCCRWGMKVCTKLNPDVKALIVKSAHLVAILGHRRLFFRPESFLLLGKDPKLKCVRLHAYLQYVHYIKVNVIDPLVLLYIVPSSEEGQGFYLVLGLRRLNWFLKFHI